ncbi:MAG TPA: polysaccharide deacetylase [Lichenihabitans sp.]|jgi:hypothetical protein|nr:polysaccharide deacetylase [Lichenihabitans sp.]
MTTPAWRPVVDALERAHGAGRTIEIWLRDDDAVAATGALGRLADLCVSFSMPILLAIIPARAEQDLAPWIADHVAVTPCQHGFAHINHAALGAKACELGGARDIAAVIEDLRRGRDRLRSLLGSRLADVLVPPWNRIAPAVIPHLPDLGFVALSAFGPPPPAVEAMLPRLNCDLDIVDWRRHRTGREPDDVAAKLAELIEAGHGRPIGLLTHHLAHDATAWAVLEEMLGTLRCHPAAAFVAPDIRRRSPA